MWTKTRTVQDLHGEKNDDLLIEEAYLYLTSSTYREECSDSKKRASNSKEGQEVSGFTGRAVLQDETGGKGIIFG